MKTKKFSKLLSLLLALVLMVGMMPATALAASNASTEWDGTTTDTAWYTGHETDTSFTIDTGAELAGLASLVNAGTDTFQGDTITLGDDIDLDGHEWTPIGTLANPFKGTFDGDDCSITNLVIGTSGSYNATFVHAGLFGRTGTASEMKDVSLVGAAIYAGAASSTGTPAMVGGLMGNNGGAVTNCSVTGAVATTGEAAYVGGIAGYSTGTFSGCTSDANVTGGNYVCAAGGIVGYTTVGITSCSTSGIVSVGEKKWDYPMAGGIVGYLYNRTDGTVKISNCHATGAVIGDDYTRLGGIAGNCEREITDSYATGNVSGGTVSILGGLVGVGACPITNSYATGSVTGGQGSGAGGLAGITSNFAVSHCWASGNVSVDGIGSIGGNDGNAAGGLIGISHYSAISYCYATGNAGGTSYGGGLIGENKSSSSPYLTITDCYAAGSATGAPYYYGGLVSNGGGAAMINCYWNSTLNAAAYGTGVVTGTPTGKTAAEMKTAAFAQLLTDGSGGNCTWVYDSSANNGYPMISGVGNAVLSGLAVNSGTLTPSFNSGITDYSVSVDSSVNGITVTPTTGDANASIKVNDADVTSGNASGTFILAANATTDIAVVITDGLFPITYTIHVTKANDYGISLDKSGIHTFSAQTQGYSAVTPLSVSVSNTGSQPTGSLTVALSGANADSFTLSSESISSIAASGTGSFTVGPKTGLLAGSYTAKVTVSGSNVTAKNFYLSFEVNPISASSSPAESMGTTLSGLGFTTAVSGSAVTVTGTKTTTTGMTLTIPAGVTVIWKASLTGAVDGLMSSLIFLNGDGTFELASGEITNTGTGMALSSIKGSIVISGGTASSSNEVATVNANHYPPNPPTLTMTGGTVTSNSTSTTSSAISAGGNTVITGGTITSANGNQVFLNVAVVVYRSDLLSKIASNSISAAIAVDPSKTYAAPTETEGLTATGYTGIAGHVTAKWMVLYPGEGTGVWVDYTNAGSGTWRVSYPAVKVVANRQLLTYDANGGSGTMAGTKVYSGQSYTVSANAFTKSSFNFTGWNTQADGKGTPYAAGETLTGAGNNDDIILYAQWSAAGSSSGGKGSGGSSGGGSSAGTTPAPTTPSTSVSGSTATATVKPTIGTDGKATAAVTAAQIGDALEKAQEASKTQDPLEVEIKVEGTSAANSVAATIPADAIKKLASGGVLGLTVSSGLGDLTFGEDALKTIAGAAAGEVKVTSSKVETSTLSDEAKKLVGSHPVYEFSVTSGDKTISEFGGTVTASLPYTPAAGEDPGAIVIYYIAADGTLTMVPDAHYDAATGRVVFTTNHFSTYAVGYNKVSFRDVADTAWYSEAVSFLSARDITSGTTTTTFSPNAVLTRGQFVTMLLKAYGIAPDTNSGDNFSDAGNTYYTGYLASAKQLGVSDGIGGNLFAPDKAVTRQEMFTMLYNALNAMKKQPEGISGKALSDFSDASAVASWAKDAMNELTKAGTISGSGGKISPTSTTTRAEMAQVLYNLLGK
jgi:hypothetical protein